MTFARNPCKAYPLKLLPPPACRRWKRWGTIPAGSRKGSIIQKGWSSWLRQDSHNVGWWCFAPPLFFAWWCSPSFPFVHLSSLIWSCRNMWKENMNIFDTYLFSCFYLKMGEERTNTPKRLRVGSSTTSKRRRRETAPPRRRKKRQRHPKVRRERSNTSKEGGGSRNSGPNWEATQLPLDGNALPDSFGVLAPGIDCTSVHLASHFARAKTAGFDVDDISHASRRANVLGWFLPNELRVFARSAGRSPRDAVSAAER